MTVAVTVLRVPRQAAELAADRLTVAGAFAVEERADGDLVELRAALGDDPDQVASRLGELPGDWEFDIEHVASEPLDTWRQFAEPIWVTEQLVLRPAWLPVVGADVVDVAIEPGAAFGLGDHPTTRLSAAAVWRTVGEGAAVLDVGCGTGALAIVAARARAARVVAIDIAEPAVVATQNNAATNGVGDRIVASPTPLAEVEGQFDVVVANILAPTLIELSVDLRRVTARGGTLIVSGLLADRYDHVLAALAPMQLADVEELDGWAALRLRHLGE